MSSCVQLASEVDTVAAELGLVLELAILLGLDCSECAARWMASTCFDLVLILSTTVPQNWCISFLKRRSLM